MPSNPSSNACRKLSTALQIFKKPQRKSLQIIALQRLFNWQKNYSVQKSIRRVCWRHFYLENLLRNQKRVLLYYASAWVRIKIGECRKFWLKPSTNIAKTLVMKNRCLSSRIGLRIQTRTFAGR